MRLIHFSVHFQRRDDSSGYADMISAPMAVAGGMALTPIHVENLRKQAMDSIHDCESVVILNWHVLASETWPRPI